MAKDLERKRARQREWVRNKRAREREMRLRRTTTLFGAKGEQRLQWVREEPEEPTAEAWREFADELSRDVQPVSPSQLPSATTKRHLLAAYPVLDLHLGALAWPEETDDAWDLEIAERTISRAMRYLVLKGGDSASAALIAFIGDIHHYDSFETVTPKGRNMLDSDTRFPKLARVGARVARRAVDTALSFHDTVHVMIEGGNHDPVASVFMGLLLEAVYENEPRVTVDTSPKNVHYFQFGRNLIGTHHGDKIKMENLPLIMARDVPKAWGETQYRYWWTGHVHHGRRSSYAEVNGVPVESFRTVAPTDAWAHQHGYRPGREIQSIILHRDFGEVARAKVNPRMLDG